MKFKKGFEKKRTYIIFLAIVVTMGIFHGIYSEREKESFQEFSRGEYGSGGKRIGIEATASYEGISITEKATSLLIQEKELTYEEKLERIEACKKRLPELILGENTNLEKISFPLNLPELDVETGVSLEWSCDNPELVDEKGNINVIEGKTNPSAELSAKLVFMELEDQWSKEICISGEISREQIEEALFRTLENQVERLSEESSGSVLVLPEKDENGVKFQWKSTSSFHSGLYFLVALVGCLMIYSNEKQRKIRRQEEIKSQVEMQLPDFMNKIVMLLSAGLVLTDAFDRVAKDYLTYRRQGNRKVLYEEFSSALRKAKESNGSFAEAMVKLAQRMEVKELTRFAVVVSNNLEKGNELADKLEMESNLLWRERKTKIEKLGRMADTKMTFPMMITLLSLVVITVVPAILEM